MSEVQLSLLGEIVPQVLSNSPVKCRHNAYATVTCHILPYIDMIIPANVPELQELLVVQI